MSETGYQPLKGQRAIVSGGSSGIGSAVCKCLAAAGAKVVVNYNSSPGGAEEVAQEIESNGGEAMVIQADVGKEDDVQKMFSQTIEKWGSVDILVANSGLQRDASFDELTLAQWEKVMNVNLTGQFLCAREAVREFKRRGIVPELSVAAGKIICMSSVHDIIPWAGHVNYAASKGGVLLMMKSLAQEVAPLKIRVNGISPGAIKTPINREAWETPEAEEKLLELIPYQRVGEPEDIGKAAVWLSSDDSDYVHGITLYVDGGMTLYPEFADNG
ncbi:Short-chain dehydrogenase/reductase SDR [Planctomycetales bacterium 10988]|nr:Short-chain dehydrogenase/reductase SDR [Planctomycetales bacterium 10988]